MMLTQLLIALDCFYGKYREKDRAGEEAKKNC